jgi:Tol biopolymer transport system component
MVTQVSSSEIGNSTSGEPAISDDGRFVAFSSHASNLVGGDTNAVFDIFRRQIEPSIGAFSRVNVATSGAQTDNHSTKPTLSADGRWVGFTSTATGLVSGDTNGASDVFTRDTQTNVTSRMSRTANGDQLQFNSLDAALSGDGRYMAFRTGSQAVVNDNNNRSDVYIVHTVEPHVTSISPSSRARGTTGTHTITGSQFLNGATVIFQGSPSVTVNLVTFVSSTQLSVSLTVPPVDNRKPGARGGEPQVEPRSKRIRVL